MFLTLMTVTMSLPTFFGWPWMTSIVRGALDGRGPCAALGDGGRSGAAGAGGGLSGLGGLSERCRARAPGKQKTTAAREREARSWSRTSLGDS